MSKKPIFIDEKDSFPAIYDQWIESCNDFVALNIFNWAYLYHSLNDENNYWNPTHNYDGTSSVTTKGTMEKLTGTDTVNSTIGDFNSTDLIKADTTTNTDFSIPYDMQNEKETGRSELHNSDREVNHSESVRDNTQDTLYGRQNDVDYTVTEIKGGNLGVTTVPTMIKELAGLESFWNTVLEYLSKELTMW